MNEEKKKVEIITLNNDIETYSFSSSIGHAIGSSNFHGQSDLKDVYTTGSVIGVSEEDLNSIRIYNSVDELRRERSANITPIDNATNEKNLEILNIKGILKPITEYII